MVLSAFHATNKLAVLMKRHLVGSLIIFLELGMAVCKQNKILCMTVASSTGKTAFYVFWHHAGFTPEQNSSLLAHLLLSCNHQIGLELLLWIPCSGEFKCCMLHLLLPFGIVFLKPAGRLICNFIVCSSEDACKTKVLPRFLE